MLLPKITTRHLFIAIGILAVYSAIAASAARGNRVAYAMGAAIACLVIPAIFYSVVYWVLFAYASFNQRRRNLNAVAKSNDILTAPEKEAP